MSNTLRSAIIAKFCVYNILSFPFLKGKCYIHLLQWPTVFVCCFPVQRKSGCSVGQPCSKLSKSSPPLKGEGRFDLESKGVSNSKCQMETKGTGRGLRGAWENWNRPRTQGTGEGVRREAESGWVFTAKFLLKEGAGGWLAGQLGTHNCLRLLWLANLPFMLIVHPIKTLLVAGKGGRNRLQEFGWPITGRCWARANAEYRVRNSAARRPVLLFNITGSFSASDTKPKITGWQNIFN